jgi:two-component SAPR family response regulator
VTETSVAYKENTVTIELENEAVIKTETIMVDSPTPDAKIVTIRGEKPEKDGRGVIIVAVALGFIALVMIGLCFKQFVLKPKQQVIELEEQIKRAKNVVEPKRDEQTQVKAKTYNVLSRDSIQPEEGVIQYEP